MKKSYYIYLLKHATEGRFKIGHSIDPHVRLKYLPDNISFDGSYVAELENEKDMKYAEKTLQDLFKHYNIEYLPKCDGYKEWFYNYAFDEILKFCHDNKCGLRLKTDLFPLPNTPYSPWAKIGLDNSIKVRIENDNCLLTLKKLFNSIKEDVIGGSCYLDLYYVMAVNRNNLHETINDHANYNCGHKFLSSNLDERNGICSYFMKFHRSSSHDFGFKEDALSFLSTFNYVDFSEPPPLFTLDSWLDFNARYC